MLGISEEFAPPPSSWKGKCGSVTIGRAGSGKDFGDILIRLETRCACVVQCKVYH
jgi:hypothetical protein